MKDERDRYTFLHEIGLCCASGFVGEIEVAHIRGPDAQFNKSLAGMGRKPHYVWTLPLHPAMHRCQHKIGEAKFWTLYNYPWQDAHRSPLHACLILEGFRTLGNADDARAWLYARLTFKGVEER